MAIICSDCKKAIKFAETINPNIRIENGINWIWAIGFKSHEDATKFDKFCNNNNCETRGVYSSHDKSRPGEYDVRFR